MLGESCQHALECTGNENTVCDGVCVCGDGYQEVEGNCAPGRWILLYIFLAFLKYDIILYFIYLRKSVTTFLENL